MAAESRFSAEQLDTPRLRGARIAPTHFPEIHRLHSDPSVMKTLSATGSVMTAEETLGHLQRCCDHWVEHGFGLWVFSHKADGRFVGRGGVMQYRIADQPVIGLAYAVLSDYWNRGFATEIAAASVQFGFDRLGLSEISAWTLPINQASQRVMAKLGLQYVQDVEYATLPHRLYRLTRTEWRRLAGRGDDRSRG